MTSQVSESIAKRVGKRPWRCYLELIALIDEHGIPPSLAELGQRLGRSPSTVGRYLDVLEAEGLIERNGRRARSIVVKAANSE